MPEPRLVNVVGQLDMIRASTGAFAIRLDDKHEIRGVASEVELDELLRWFNKRVLLQGTAVFRPSGKRLGVEAKAVTDGGDQGPLWSTIPKPAMARPRDWRVAQGSTTGVNAIFARIPSDESDEEVLRVLEEMS